MKNHTHIQKIVLLGLSLITVLVATGQHKYAEWYTTFDSATNGEGSNFNNIISDGESIIVNGVYTGTGIFQDVILPAATDKNAIFTKLDFNGAHQWISTLTENNIDALFDVVVDDEGNIILCGYSSSSDSIRFNGVGIVKNPQSFSNTSLVNHPMFLSKDYRQTYVNDDSKRSHSTLQDLKYASQRID